MTDINELKQYVDIQDINIQATLRQEFEDFSHEVTHILEDYEALIEGRIGSIHTELWEGVDDALSQSSVFPVQNKVIYEALANKANINHIHDYCTLDTINSLLSNKVDKEIGKGLSATNFTSEDKAHLDTIYNNYITVGNSQVLSVKGIAEITPQTGHVIITPASLGLDATRDLDKPISSAMATALAGKVDIENGKGLSTNDFTTAYKNKLDNIDLANLTITVDDELSLSSNNPVKNRIIKSQLDLKAPIASPIFTGEPRSVTPANGDNSTRIATTAFVAAAITSGSITLDSALSLESQNAVQNRTIAAALELKAALASPSFTGTPLAPTAATNTNNTQIATTAFVKNAINEYASDSFVVNYGVTALADIYNAYQANKYITCKFQERMYSLYSCELAETIYTIKFNCIENNIYYSITATKNGENNAVWTNTSTTYVLKSTPVVSTYPIYENYLAATPDPTLDNQFVTKRYVDRLTSAVSASYITLGQDTTKLALLGYKATAEGELNNSQGDYSHTEGYINTASGFASHAEGSHTSIASPYGHAGGYYNLDLTTTEEDPETGDIVFTSQWLELIGNGTESTPANARTLDLNGNETLAGKLTVGAAPTNNMDVTTKQYVDTVVTAIDYNENDSTAIGYIKNRPFYSEYNTVTTNIRQGATIPPAGFVTDSANGMCYNWSGTPAQSAIRALNYLFGADDYINVRFNNIAYVLVQGRMQGGYAIWSVERITTALPGNSSICSSTNPIAFYIPTNSTSFPIKVCIHNSLYQNNNINFEIISLVVLTETVHTINNKYLAGVTLSGAMATNVVDITDSSLKIANTAFVQQAIEAKADFGHSSNSTGLYHPTSISPQSVGNGSLLLTEASGTTLGTKSLSVSTGYGINLKSEAAAGATQYAVQNNYVNRIICSGLVGGVIAQSEETANVTVKVLSVQINGADFTPSSNWSSDDIIITTETSLNPTEAITQIRAYPAQQGFSNLYIGQQVANLSSSNGASLIGGQKVTNKSGNANALIGQEIFNAGNGSAIFGRRHINRKNRVFLAGTGHDTTNATENVAALGAYSSLDSTTSFAIGNGTDEEHRSNVFKVDTSGNTTIAGTLITSSSGITIGSTTITETQLQQLLALLT